MLNFDLDAFPDKPLINWTRMVSYDRKRALFPRLWRFREINIFAPGDLTQGYLQPRELCQRWDLARCFDCSSATADQCEHLEEYLTEDPAGLKLAAEGPALHEPLELFPFRDVVRLDVPEHFADMRDGVTELGDQRLSFFMSLPPFVLT